MAKMGELKRAAKIFGVASSTLRQHGWSTASPDGVQAVINDPPDWLITARENRRSKRAKQQKRRADQSTASRLGIPVRVVRQRGIGPDDVEELLASSPAWLITACQRCQGQREREWADAQRRAAREAGEREVAEACLRAIKDRGDTDAWAAGVLHAAGIHQIDFEDGTSVPVLLSSLKVVR
jgi:hypothetical protein